MDSSSAQTADSADQVPAKKRKSSPLGLLIGVGISVLLIGIFAYSVDWNEFSGQLKHVKLLYFIPIVFSIVLSFWIREIRWKLLLPGDQAAPGAARARFDSIAVSFLATFILPFRAGEIVRAWALNRWQGTSIAAGFASVVVERAFDVLLVLVLLGAALAQVDHAPPEVVRGAIGLGAIGGVILAVMIASYFFSRQMIALARWGLNLVIPSKYASVRDSLVRFLEEFIGGLKVISSFKELGLVFFWSLVLWLEMALGIHLTLYAFGQTPSFWVSIGTNSIVALAVAIPSAPGFLGTYHFGCWVGLTLMYGFPKDLAVAIAVVLHTLSLVTIVALGLYVLRARGMKFTELRKRGASSEQVC